MTSEPHRPAWSARADESYALLQGLARRVEALEQRPVSMPHVVLKAGEVLVCTGPEWLTGEDVQRMGGDVDRIGLRGRVIVLSEGMRAEVTRPGPDPEVVAAHDAFLDEQIRAERDER